MKNNNCKICGKEFIRTSANQLYCSLSCKNKAYYKDNKQKILNRVKKYQELNRDKLLQRDRELYQIHKEELQYIQKNRLKTDINFRLKHNLRVRIHDAIKNRIKSESTIQLIGCSIDNLKQYLESQFKNGMTWSNYGVWEVDHIRPCCTFDLSEISEQKKCFNYTNLQPLWKKENRSKAKKFIAS